jgi:hypothetical protein
MARAMRLSLLPLLALFLVPGLVSAQPADRREDLLKLMAQAPAPGEKCGTGNRWLAFLSAAPHDDATIEALLALYREADAPPRRQALALQALKQTRRPELRPFWLELLRKTEDTSEPLQDVMMGLARSGTDEDVRELLGQLGRGEQRDLAILAAFSVHPVGTEWERVGALAEAPSASARVRGSAWDLVVDHGPKPLRARLIDVGLGSKDEWIRGRAIWLVGDHVTLGHLDTLLAALREPGDYREQLDDLISWSLLFKGLADKDAATEARALGLTKRALGKEPVLASAPGVHFVLGLWREREGHYTEAETLYRRGRELATRVPDASSDEVRGLEVALRFRLAQLLAATGRLPEARGMAKGLTQAVQEVHEASGVLDNFNFIKSGGTPSIVAFQFEKELNARQLDLSGRILRQSGKSMQVEVSLRNVSRAPVRVRLGQTHDKVPFAAKSLHLDTSERNRTWLSLYGPWQARQLAPGGSMRATFEVPLPPKGEPVRRLMLRATVERVEGSSPVEEELEHWVTLKR